MGENKKQMWRCPLCGNLTEDLPKVCKVCGEKILLSAQPVWVDAETKKEDISPWRVTKPIFGERPYKPKPNRQAEEAERQRKAEAARKAEEERKAAEEARKAAEEAERQRKAEEARKAEQERKAAEEARKAAEEAERQRKAEEARKAEQERKADEEARKAVEEAERQRKAEEAKKAEEERKAAREAERQRRAEEAKKAEEARQAEAARKAEEAKRLAEEKKAAAKAKKAAEEAERQRKAEADQKAAEERKAAREAERARKAEEAEKAKAERAAAREAARARRDAEKKSLHPGVICGAVAAAAMMIAVILALPGSGNVVVPETGETQTSGENQENIPPYVVEDPMNDTAPDDRIWDRDVLLADPYYLEEGAAEREFLQALQDDAVTSIVLNPGVHLQLTQETVIDKPVLVMKGASIVVLTYVQIVGDGIVILDGDLNTEGFVQTRDGGRIWVDQGWFWSVSPILLERAKDLRGKDGLPDGLEDPNYDVHQRVVVRSEAIFEEAVRVTSATELIEAAKDPATKAIVIDGEVTLSNEFVHTVPIRINEGATVYCGGDRTGDEDFGWSVAGGGVLYNHGTMKGYIQTGDFFDVGVEPVLVNDGTLDLSAGMDLYSCFLLNRGDILWEHGGRNHWGSLCNAGTIILNCSETSSLGGFVCNAKNLVINGQCDIVDCDRINNVGLLQVKAGCRLDFRAYMFNAGEIRVEDKATMSNMGLIEMGYQGNIVEYDGVFLNEGGAVLMSGGSYSVWHEMGGWVSSTYTYDDSVGETAYVADADSFLQALEDEKVSRIEVVDSFHVTHSVSINKNVWIWWNATLSMDARSNLTIDGATLENSGTLKVNHVLVRNNGSFLNNGTVMMQLTDGEIRVGDNTDADNSRELFVNWGVLTMSDASLRLNSASLYVEFGEIRQCGRLAIEGDSCFINRSGYQHIDRVDVQGGTYRNLQYLEIDGVVNVESGSCHIFRETKVAGDLIIGENGMMEVYAADLEIVQGGTLENAGEIDICGPDSMMVLIRGKCVNTGYLRFVGEGQYIVGARSAVYEGGILDNQGDLYLSYGAELIVEEGGQLIGKAPKKKDEPVRFNGVG